MSLRPKTRRRMMIVAVIAMAMILVSTAFVLWRRNQLKTETAMYRAQGMEAYQEEDWPATLKSLSQYIGREREDAEARYRFADARRHLPLKQGAHLAEAIGHLRAALNLKPDYIEAQELLLELLPAARLHSEILDLTDTILARDPNHVEALRARAFALAGLNRYDDAIDTLDKLLAQNPDSFRAHALRLQIMRAMETNEQQIIDHARRLRDRHAGDPAYETLMAQAYLLVGRRDEGIKRLEAAAAGRPTDPIVAIMLINFCHSVGRFDLSLPVLEALVAGPEGEAFRPMLAQRLFEIKRPDEAIAYLPATPVEQQTVDELALRAMMLLDADRADDAAELLAEIQRRADELSNRPLGENDIDYAPDIWVLILKHWSTPDDQPMPELITVAQRGVERQPGNAYFRHCLARGYASVGEGDLAISTWAATIPLRRGWVVPYVQLARQLIGKGGLREGLATAMFARDLAPDYADAQAVYLAARSAALPLNPDDSAERLLADTQRFLVDHPSDILAQVIQIQTLLRLDRKPDAADAIRMAIPRTQSEQTLLQLAAISEAQDLGVAENCLERARRIHGNTPSLALHQAMVSRQDGAESDQIIAGFDQRRAAAKDPQQFEWLVARARLIESLDDQRATAAWAELMKQHGDSVRTAIALIQSRAAWADRDLVRRAIDQLEQATGKRGVAWRIAKARWILGGEPSEAELSSCSVMLTDLITQMPNAVEPHMLQARCRQLMGDFNDAREQLERSANLRPNDPAIKLDLARLQMQTGYRTSAITTLGQLLRQRDRLTPSQRLAVATMFSQLGESDQLIALLADMPQDQLVSAEKAQLARTYLSLNQIDKATPIIEGLYEATIDPLTIQLSAELLARQGKMEQAMARLDELDNVEAEESLKHLVRAEFAERFIGREQGHEYLQKAAESAPDNALVWTPLLVFEMRAGMVDEALANAIKARDALTSPPDTIVALVDNAAKIRPLAGDPALRGLLASMVQSRRNIQPALTMVNLLDRLRQNKMTPDEFVMAIEQYADQHTDYLEGQLVVTTLLSRSGRIDAAVDWALRAVDRFPESPAPAESAARLLAAAGRFDESLNVARQWRQRQSTAPLPADQFIAEVHLQLNQPQQTLDVLEPYAELIEGNPEALASVVTVRAAARARLKQYEQIEQQFKALCERHPRWQTIWIELAMNQVVDQKIAARWLDMVRPTIDKQNVQARVTLSEAYYVLAQRTSREDLGELSESLLSKLAEDFPESGTVALSQAIRYERAGQRDKAAAAYRRTLELIPNQPIAANNLAMAIVTDGGDLDEADQLIQDAMAASANVATFYDTAAQIAAKRGDYPKAIELLLSASSLEPQRLEWRVNLAEMMVKAQRLDDARKIVERLAGIDVDDRRISEEVREKLKMLREQFADQAAVVE